MAPRFQPKASWFGSLTYLNRARAFGDTDYFGRTVTLADGAPGSLLGKNAYEASDMPTALSTATQSAFVYGDFGHYCIVDRLGSRVLWVPHLMGDANRPRGMGGWFHVKRAGAEPTSTTAFVLSSNPGA